MINKWRSVDELPSVEISHSPATEEIRVSNNNPIQLWWALMIWTRSGSIQLWFCWIWPNTRPRSFLTNLFRSAEEFREWSDGFREWPWFWRDTRRSQDDVRECTWICREFVISFAVCDVLGNLAFSREGVFISDLDDEEVSAWSLDVAELLVEAFDKGITEILEIF